MIVPDMRGFGSSEKPLQDYRTRTAATDIYELVRHLGHDKIAIVGHDIGVRVSYRYCLDHEAEVDRLTLLDGTHPLEQLGPQTPEGVRERWHSYFHQIPDLAEHLVRGNEEAYLRHFYRNWSVNQAMMSDEEVAVYATAYSQPGALRGGFSYYRAAAYEDPPDWRADADRVLGHSRAVPVGRTAATHVGGRRAGSRGVVAASGIQPADAVYRRRRALPPRGETRRG